LARDIHEFIHNIPEQSGYIQSARAAIEIRLAENAEITTRRIVRLTWALLVVSAALLVFAIWQMIIIKKDADIHSHQFQTGQNHEGIRAVANDANIKTVPLGSTDQHGSSPSVQTVTNVPSVDELLDQYLNSGHKKP
jgi:hypothetical protein